MAFNEHIIGIHQPVWVRVEKKLGGETLRHVVRATPGRIIFNRNIPRIWALSSASTRTAPPSEQIL